MAKTLIIHCNLCYSEPSVWRKIEVGEDYNLGKFLKEVLNSYEVSTWSHPHLLKATTSGKRRPDPDTIEMYAPKQMCKAWGYKMMYDEARHTVGEVFSHVGKRYIMEYDFGDGWMIELELIERGEDQELGEPVVLDGEGFGILDDCGGIYTLNDFVILQKAYAENASEKDIQNLIEEYGMPYRQAERYKNFASDIDLLTRR